MLSDSAISACARYVVEKARHVIESFGDRPPGSEAERKTQELVRDELASCCDGEILFEPFEVAGKAFFSMHFVGSSFLFLSILLWPLHPVISVLLDVMALSVWYFQLVRYKLYLDPFFPKSISHNVYGRIRPKGEIKRRIILSGHPDAACEFRYSFVAPRFFPYIVMILLAGMALIVLVHLAGLAAWIAGGPVWGFIHRFAALEWLLLPGALAGAFFNNVSRTVPGANDNLSAVFTATGIAKHLKESGLRLEHTEIGFASLGSEEAGLRGAKVFAERHKREFEDVETSVIVLETLRDLGHLGIFNRDMNGTVRLDEDVCHLLHEAGEACGLDLPYDNVYLGSTDAAAFAQAGWRAAMLGAMDPHPADYYHTRLDTWDNMDEACLRQAVAVVCAALRIYDSAAS